MPFVGCHLAIADDVFVQLKGELGIERPKDIPRDDQDKPVRRDWFRPKKEKGQSTLRK